MSSDSLLFLLSWTQVIYSGTVLTYSSDKCSDLESSWVFSFITCGGVNAPLTPAHFLTSFFLQLGEAHQSHDCGDFHCERLGGRKWSGSQASQQSHSTPVEAESLSTKTIRAGSEEAYCLMEAAKSFPPTARGHAGRKQAAAEQNVLSFIVTLGIQNTS